MHVVPAMLEIIRMASFVRLCTQIYFYFYGQKRHDESIGPITIGARTKSAFRVRENVLF